MPIRTFVFALAFALISITGQAQDEPRISIVAEGLYYPAGMALLPDGSVLIAEAGGHGERSAGVSLLQRDGRLGRLISGIPSTFSKDNLLSAPVMAVSPDGETLVLALAGSQFYSLPSARWPRVCRRPRSVPPIWRAGRPDVAAYSCCIRSTSPLITSGAPLATDAAGNGLVVESEDGSIRYLHRFAALENPDHAGGGLEALPTGLARHGDSHYVTLFGGCPHVPNSGKLVEITRDGRQKTLVAGLNMPIDVAVDGAGDLWILEFALLAPRNDCFTDLLEQNPSGRLSRINGQGMLETILDDLHFPAGLLPLPDGGLYITETYAGRVLRVDFEPQPQTPQRFPPRDMPEANRHRDRRFRSSFARRYRCARIDALSRAGINRSGKRVDAAGARSIL